MNTELFKSKKFRAAIAAAIASILTFCVTKFGLNLDVSEIMTLLGAISAPFLIYIGAEGYSEKDAKAVIETAKIKSDMAEQVLSSIVNAKNEETSK